MLSRKLFDPKSDAVRGASRNPGRMGNGGFTHPVGSGFPPNELVLPGAFRDCGFPYWSHWAVGAADQPTANP
jgi:hypothetical protein